VSEKNASPARRAGKNPGTLHLVRAAHDPRAAALTALTMVLGGGVDSQAAVDAALSSPLMVPTDKRLCTELTYGVLRWHVRLRLFARRFLRKPEKLPGEMRLALLLALYEMTFLRIPSHATVHWAVSHVGNRFGKGLGGVANGALRSMQRSIKDFSSPSLYADGQEEEALLSCRYAMPEWIVRLWRRSYGEAETLALLEAARLAPPSGLRLNRAKSGWEALRESLLRGEEKKDDSGRKLRSGKEAEKGSGSVNAVGACALAFSGGLPWRAKELLAEGKASRQGAASYEALEFFEPAVWEGPLWDCCAGRGGKTLALLEQGVAVTLASDVSARRLQGIREEYARLGLADPPCPPAFAFSASDPAALPDDLPERFAFILVDAPCSGLGTLSRRPEIRLRRTPEDLAALTDRQARILRAVWRRLEPGGRLLYLTCTLNPAENEERIAHFLADNQDADLCREFATPPASPLREFFYGAMLRRRASP
jgi:16S rRNA (cytosine967-C5)-methyltransferase